MIENFQEPGSEDIMHDAIVSSPTYKGCYLFWCLSGGENQIPEVISKRVTINTYSINSGDNNPNAGIIG